MNLKEALKIIDSGSAFSLRCVSYDKSRKKGGKVIFFSELKVSKLKGEFDKTKLPNEPSKNHYENATRTCHQCINGEPTASLRTFHIFLMLEVNGEKVML